MQATYSHYFSVRDPSGKLRLETVRKDEAIRFARRVNTEDDATCTIDQIDRSGR